MKSSKLLISLAVGGCFLAGSRWSLGAEELVELEKRYIRESWGEERMVATTGMFYQRAWRESPRSSQMLDLETLAPYGVNSPEDLSGWAASVAAPARFGHLTTPNIRGDVAETYRNGQRLSANLFGVMPDFVFFEGAEITRGPAPAVYGPGFYSGGFVNYATKRAQLGRRLTRLSMELGGWQPDGDSYWRLEGSIDTNLPLGEKNALRLIYHGRTDETRFSRNGGKNETQAGLLAWTGRLSPETSWRMDVEVQWLAQPQLMGINRPSQELIDKGIYYTGRAPDVGGAWRQPWYLTPSGKTILADDATLLSTGDFSNAVRMVGQSELLVECSPSWELVHLALYEQVNRRRFHEFEYAEYVDQQTLDQRLEMRGGGEWLGGRHTLQFGLALRFEGRESFVNYFNETYFAFDLTQPPPYSTRETYPQAYYPGRTGPGGRAFFGAQEGSPETTCSNLWQPSVFFQYQWQPSGWLEVLAGGRADGMWVEAQDPFPPPGSEPWKDEHDEHTTSGYLSLVAAPWAEGRIYVTANRTYAINGSVTGGGLLLFAGRINPDDLHNRSDLLEWGWKQEWPEARLVSGLALWQQTRRRNEFRGGKSDLFLRGWEWETTWRPHKEWQVWCNLTWTEGRYVDSAPFQAGGRSIYSYYAAGTGPGGLGTGKGLEPFPGVDQVPPGDYELPGLSRWVLQSGVEWNSEGWSVRLWGQWQSRQSGNLDQEFFLPAQQTLHLGLGKRIGRWEVAVRVLNLTNETNWVHNGDTFLNNQLLFRASPRQVETTVTLDL